MATKNPKNSAWSLGGVGGDGEGLSSREECAPTSHPTGGGGTGEKRRCDISKPRGKAVQGPLTSSGASRTKEGRGGKGRRTEEEGYQATLERRSSKGGLTARGFPDKGS